MKWPRQGMETAWQGESHADPQARGPPISHSEERGLSHSLLPFFLPVPHSLGVDLLGLEKEKKRNREDEGNE